MRSPNLNNLRKKVARENNYHDIDYQDNFLTNFISVKNDQGLKLHKSRGFANYLWACILYFIYSNKKIGVGKAHTTSLEKWSCILGKVIILPIVSIILFLLANGIIGHWFWGILAVGVFLYFMFE